jgi:hypothetical protein
MAYNTLLTIGAPINLVANQVYALPPSACYYAVVGTAPTVSVDGSTYAAPPAAPGPLVSGFIKSSAADTIITLKRL